MTQLDVDVDKLIQQTRQYEFADGLRDLQLAVSIGLGGVICWLVLNPAWMIFLFNLVNAYGRWVAWVNLLLVFLPTLAAWGVFGLTNYVRRRWLWRESGMVKPSRWMVTRRGTALSAAILIGGVVLGFGLHQIGWADDRLMLQMVWAATGWSFGYTLVGLGRNTGLARYVWMGAIGGSASTIVLFLPLTFGQAALAFGLWWGLALAVSGIVVLRRALPSVRKVSHGG
ncbi:MAG: hypothetical protein SXV54_02645 [Chloroflexota bacterium]|nr:hypothetical protein [Chloroflexota bacterium]